jgi:hypothetical protein
VYAFSLNSPAVGKLVLGWYATPAGAHAAANTKQVAVALASTSFASKGTRTVKLLLTKAGRSLVSHSRSVTLSIKGVFTTAQGQRVVLSKSFVLGH